MELLEKKIRQWARDYAKALVAIDEEIDKDILNGIDVRKLHDAVDKMALLQARIHGALLAVKAYDPEAYGKRIAFMDQVRDDPKLYAVSETY